MMSTSESTSVHIAKIDRSEPYGLNPAYFLADRKAWIMVGSVLVLFALGLSAHYLGLRLALNAAEPLVYWFAVGSLLLAPVAVHLLAPWILARDREKQVASLASGELHWQLAESYQATDLEGGAARRRAASPAALERVLRAQFPGLEERAVEAAADLSVLLSSLDAASGRITTYAAEAGGRDPADQRHSEILLMVTEGVGSPYTYARAFGPVRVVIPLGLPMLTPSSAAEGPEQRKAEAEALLSHELAHVLLRDGPSELLSDVRLLSIADALNRSVGALWWTTLGTAIVAQFGQAEATKPSSTSVPLIAAMALSTVLGGLGWRLAPLPLKGGPTRARALAWNSALTLFFGLLLAALAWRSPLGAGAATWTVLWLNLGVALLLGRVCTYLGRQQMEHMADDAASRALMSADGLKGSAEQLSSALRRVHQACGEVEWVQTLPSFAAGNAGDGGVEAFWTSMAGIGSTKEDLGDFLQDDDEPTRVSEQPKAGREMGSQMALRLLRGVLGLVERLRPIYASHPSLSQRIDAVTNPDRMVATDTTLPMLFSAAPMLLLPSLSSELRLDPLIGAVTQDALLVPLGGFLLLFALVTRRPYRKVVSAEIDVSRSMLSWSALLDHTQAALREWLAGSAGMTSSYPMVQVQSETTEIAPWGLRAELARVVQVLLLAAVFGVGFGVLYRFLRYAGTGASVASSALSRDIGAARSVFDIANSLQPLGGVVFLFGGAFALYLWLRFTELVRWHYMAGRVWWVRALAFAASTVLAMALAGLVTEKLSRIVAAAAELIRSIAPGLGGSWFLAAIASTRPEARAVLELTGGFVVLGATYAALQFAYPLRFGAAYCWFGHAVQRQWLNILGQPEEEDGDWGPERCECGRSPQAPLRLRLRHRRDPHLGDRLPNRTSSGVLLPLILLVALLPLPPLVLAGLASMGAHTNCARTATLWGEEVSKLCPVPGSTDQADPPEAPLVWKNPPSEDGLRRRVRLEAPKDLPQYYGGSASSYAQNEVPLGCAEGVRQAAAWMGYMQMCAMAPPERLPSSAECVDVLSSDDPALACDCVWAKDADPDIQRDTRVRAVGRLYEVAQGYLDATEEICDDLDHPPRALRWQDWVDFLDDEVAPRVYAGVAVAESPNDYLRSDGQSLPRATSPRCEDKVEAWLAGEAVDEAESYSCLTPAAVQRLLLEADIAVAIARAVANVQLSSGGQGEDLMADLPLYGAQFDRLNRVEQRLINLRFVLEKWGFAESEDDDCEQVEQRDALALAMETEGSRQALLEMVRVGPTDDAGEDSLGDIVRRERLDQSCAYSSAGQKPELDWMARLACSTRQSDGDPTARDLIRQCSQTQQLIGDPESDSYGRLGARCKDLGIQNAAECRELAFLPERCTEDEIKALATEVATRVVHGPFQPGVVHGASRSGGAEAVEAQRRRQTDLAMVEFSRCPNGRKLRGLAHGELAGRTLCWAYGELVAGAVVALKPVEPAPGSDPKDPEVINEMAKTVVENAQAGAPDLDLIRALGWGVVGDDPRFAFAASSSSVLLLAKDVRERHGDDAQRCERMEEASRYGWLARIGTLTARAQRAKRAIIARMARAMRATSDAQKDRELWREPCLHAATSDSAARQCAEQLSRVLDQPVKLSADTTSLNRVLGTDNMRTCVKFGMVSAGTLSPGHCGESEDACEAIRSGEWLVLPGKVEPSLEVCDWPYVTLVAIRELAKKDAKIEGEDAKSGAMPSGAAGVGQAGAADASSGGQSAAEAPSRPSGEAAGTEPNAPQTGGGATPQEGGGDGALEPQKHDVGEILQMLEERAVEINHQECIDPNFLSNW